jgi:hypothetical protein
MAAGERNSITVVKKSTITVRSSQLLLLPLLLLAPMLYV